MKVMTRALQVLPEYDLRSICEIPEMLLFDIETTGLQKEATQVYLIGCAYCEAGIWYARQWLTETASDELPVLEDFLQFASGYRMLVHFNGNRFDIPYLQYKADYYRTDKDLSGHQSFDIYQSVRRARKLLGLKSMSQRSLEEFLGIHREDQMDGGLLIPVYYEYEKTGSPELEHLLLLHNFDDLQGMIRILPVLAYGQIFDGNYLFKGLRDCTADAGKLCSDDPEKNFRKAWVEDVRADFSENGWKDRETKTQNRMLLEYQLPEPVPVACSAAVPLPRTGSLPEDSGQSAIEIQIRLAQDLLQICLQGYEGTGLIPLEPVSDYYYLTEEDRVIHRDVAQFVDRSKRVKATRKNCFLKQKGVFFPQIEPRVTPVCQLPGDCKHFFMEKGQLMQQDAGVYLQIAQDIIHGL